MSETLQEFLADHWNTLPADLQVVLPGLSPIGVKVHRQAAILGGKHYLRSPSWGTLMTEDTARARELRVRGGDTLWRAPPAPLLPPTPPEA
jgi:hypothetical protein